MGELSGRTIVVTGAAGGIGAAASRMAAKAGARLVLIDPNEQGLHSLAASLAGSGHVISPSHLDSPKACAEALARIDGPLYALVHMAGIFVPHELEPGARNVYDRTIAANMTNGFDLVCAMMDRLATDEPARPCLRARKPTDAAALAMLRTPWQRAASLGSSGRWRAT